MSDVENNNENKDNQLNIDEVLKNEAIQQHISKLIQEESEKLLTGIKSNRDQILKEKKELEDKFKKELENSGKIEELSTTIRIERDKEWEIKFNPLKEENENLKNQLNEIKTVQKSSKLNDIAIKELANFKIHQASIEDAQEKFRAAFDFDDKGNLKHKQDKLNDQNKPYTAADFYNDLQKTKPHWFNGVSGSGTTTNTNNSNKESKYTPEQIAKMTRAEYQDAKRKGLLK